MSTIPTYSKQRLYPSHIVALAAQKTPIVAITAFDSFSAAVAEAAGVDIILVGDSLATTVQGRDNTLSVTMEQMLYHSEIVSRCTSRPLVVADMPYMSYHITMEDAVRNAGRFIKEAGAGAVKVEGGVSSRNVIERIVAAEIPVMGHIGLTPQAIHRMGGFKVQGKATSTFGSKSAAQLLEDARAVEDAGAFAVVIEGVPAPLAASISASLTIPTIGIGASSACAGQILVFSDILGFGCGRTPKFVKRYLEGAALCVEAVQQYASEVRSRSFPASEHEYRDNSAAPSSPTPLAPVPHEH